MTRDSGTVRAAKTKIVTEPVFRLSVVAGADAGKSLTVNALAAPRVLVGTSPACELCLTDRKVSRRHLSFELSKAGIALRDLGSTNGTTINGVRIGEALLHGGETIELGDSRLLVARDDDDDASLVSEETSFGRYLGHSVAMRKLYPTIARLAASDLPLLVEGETGTGKELLAECIHEATPRAQGPFVVFEPASFAAPDVEAVLFGSNDKHGIFEEAAGGTLLVDEIADVPLALQARLLSAIERGEVRRGGGAAIPIDVRLIATTRRDLDRAVADGAFREDLFFRVAVTRVELPPLRKRREDIEVLAGHFWGGPPSEELLRALERMGSYEWPGNVRELASFVSRLRVVGEAGTTEGGAEPSVGLGRDFIDAVVAEHLPLGPARDKVVAEFERRYVEDAFVRNGHNVTKAAAAAGIARRYFRALRARQRA